MEKIC